jgi:NADPH2:quinone reductase
MRAITYSQFGPARDVLTLEDMDTPTPSAGEVLIELTFSGVNPSDVKVRAGGRPGVSAPAFPKIVPHSDGAGKIIRVGEGVSQDRIGTSVWIWNCQWNRPFGTAATHIVVPADQAVPMPAGVSMQTGAALGIPGLTACHTTLGGGSVKGKTVLVQGGAGTVGLLAIQLAAWDGAHVIATARPSDFEDCMRAGAHCVVDYRAEDRAEQILKANNNALIDRIIEVEFGINVTLDTDIIAPSGVIAAYGSAKLMSPEVPFMAMMFKNATLDTTLVYVLPPEPRNIAIAKLHQALTEDALICPVAQTYALSDCAAAHERVEAGQRKGSVLLDMSL